MKALPIWGDRDWYSGGGYVIRLRGKTVDLLKRFKLLQEYQWIDKMTRAILIEFSSYNAQVSIK